jgi:hypothetical protein
MVRFPHLLLFGLLLAGDGDALPIRYNTVTIAPTRSSIYIGFVTLALGTMARHDDIYASDYSAKVWPYFFWDEQGKIFIKVPDEALRRLQKGEAVDFTGHAVCDDGDQRKITGHAVPADLNSGSIQVRVFVTKYISLKFDTSYRVGTGAL